MSALSDVENLRLHDISVGDVRDDPRWLALMGEGAVKAFLADMARKHLPGEHDQDRHGNDHGGIDVPSPLDKLKLARLAPSGFRVRSSKKLKTDNADVGIAEVDSPDGPQVRVGVIGNESGKWDAGFVGEARKAQLRQEIGRREALMESDSDDVDDDIEDQISELESELEDLERERTAIVSPHLMADFRRQLGEGLTVAKANKAEQDAAVKEFDALDEKRDAIIAEHSDPDLERRISRVSSELRSKLKIIKGLENGPNPRHWTPEFIAELIEMHKADVPGLEAELVPLLARRAELMPPDARARLEDLDRQYAALNEADIDDMLTSAEVSAPNGTRIRAEIWGSDDEDGGWADTRFYVLKPGETRDDADGGDDYAYFSGLRGLNKLIAGLAESSGDQPKSAAARRILRKHLPGQHPQESHGNDHGVDVIPGDKLGLAKRIQLGPGEKLLSSRKIRTRTDSDSWDMVAAEVDTPAGRQVRLGVVSDAKNWAGGPDLERKRRVAEMDARIERIEAGDEDVSNDLYEQLLDERADLGNEDDDAYDRTVALSPSDVATLRAGIESGVDDAKAHAKAWEKFRTDHADAFDESDRLFQLGRRRPLTPEEEAHQAQVHRTLNEFGETELTHAEGFFPGGPDGDFAYEVISNDDAEWTVRFGVRPPDANDNWFIGSIIDDEAVIAPAQLKALLKDLDELSGDQSKSFPHPQGKHLPGRHDQSSHGRGGRRAVAAVLDAPDVPKPEPVAEPKPPKPRRAPKPKPPSEAPKPSRPRQPRASRAAKLTPAQAQAMQSEMLSGKPWDSSHVGSLRAWTTSGFHDIRMMIDNPDHEPFLGIGDGAQVKAHIRNMHDAMRPLPKAVKVFRKVDPQGVGLKNGDDPKQLVGKRKQNPNFTATSVEPDAGFLGAFRPIHIEIDAPAGTSAAYLEGITETNGEYELLLDAGTVLEFTEASDRGDGVTVIKARVIP